MFLFGQGNFFLIREESRKMKILKSVAAQEKFKDFCCRFFLAFTNRKRFFQKVVLRMSAIISTTTRENESIM